MLQSLLCCTLSRFKCMMELMILVRQQFYTVLLQKQILTLRVKKQKGGWYSNCTWGVVIVNLWVASLITTNKIPHFAHQVWSRCQIGPTEPHLKNTHTPICPDTSTSNQSFYTSTKTELPVDVFGPWEAFMTLNLSRWDDKLYIHRWFSRALPWPVYTLFQRQNWTVNFQIHITTTVLHS